MPRYFFHSPGDDPSLDEGMELPSPKEAREQASLAAAEILRDIDGAFWAKPEWPMQVTDEQGATVCLLSIKGTVSPG
jgi:hypothetical protein